jgi:hypothetical protein
MNGGLKCGAKTRAGTPCQHAAGQGTQHVGWGRCKLHGGNTPTGIKAAATARAENAVATYGLPVEVDALTALRQEVWRTAGHVAWLEAEIRELEPAALSWGLTKQTTGEHGESTYAAAVPVLLDLYHRERRHLVIVAAEAIRCGVEERIARVEEAKGRMVGEAMQKMFADPQLGLTAKQRAALPDVVPRHLHAVEGIA